MRPAADRYYWASGLVIAGRAVSSGHPTHMNLLPHLLPFCALLSGDPAEVTNTPAGTTEYRLAPASTRSSPYAARPASANVTDSQPNVSTGAKPSRRSASPYGVIRPEPDVAEFPAAPLLPLPYRGRGSRSVPSYLPSQWAEPAVRGVNAPPTIIDPPQPAVPTAKNHTAARRASSLTPSAP